MDIRRISFGAIIIFCLASRGISKSLDVVWVSPTEGTFYNPGSTIVAKWTASSPVVSPGFKLCLVSTSKGVGESTAGVEGRGADKNKDEDVDERCGGVIWPQVREAEDGFRVAITVPEVTEIYVYCLEMQDDFGNIFTSPVFRLGRGPSEQALSSSLLPNAQATGKLPETSEALSATAKHSLIFPGSSSALPSASNSTVTFQPFGVPATSSPSIRPDILTSRRPVSTAAVAVPLSVVSGIILVAGLLCLRTRRELAKDRKRELKGLIISQKSSGPEGYGSIGEVQRALSVLSNKACSEYSNKVDPMPVFLEKPEPRIATHDPYTRIPISISSRIYDHPQELQSTESSIRRGKSLTANYTAVGTVPCLEEIYSQTLSFSSSNPAIPSTLLPARMSPLHLRSESPGSDHPLPAPPQISTLSPSGSTNVYDAIAAKLKGYQ